MPPQPPRTDHLASLLRPAVAALVPAADLDRARRVERAIGEDGMVRSTAIRLAPQVVTLFAPGTAAVANNVAQEIRVPTDGTIVFADLHAKTWPNGSALTARLVADGNTAAPVLTFVMVNADDGVIAGGVTAPVSAGSVLRLDITGVGSTTAGGDISVNLILQPS